MEEIWKDIPSYEGKYQISNLGNVKSLKYRRQNYSKELTPKKNNDGYLWVELWNNGKKENYLIHRLVAMTFISNPLNLGEINHKDENPQNNNVDNLEWCTRLYNVRYSKKSGSKNRKITKRKIKYNKKLLMYDKNESFIKCYDSLKLCCQENGYNPWGITECCHGKRKTAYGYKWRFAE